MDALIVASLVTATLAGLAALFAPCCIGVLLPAYFASIFRQKRTVLLMTVVFFLGLLAVFLPIGLGFGLIGDVFKQFHRTIYIIGSIFLFSLGSFLILGKHLSMPYNIGHKGKVTGAVSVFVLGIFSGFATLCCAPVLAGAMALSILPGSILWGGIYSFFYVLGMVSPLFIISYFADKTKIMERTSIFKRNFTYKIFGNSVSVTFSNLLSGAIFILMSVLIMYFVIANRVATHSSTQTSINLFVAILSESIKSFLQRVPLGAALAFLAIVAIGVILLLRKRRNRA